MRIEDAGSDAAEALVDVRDRAVAAVIEVSDMWSNQSRDSVRPSIGTSEVLIVGGMSNGDSPSDAYDSVLVFLGCGPHLVSGFDL